MVQSSLDLTLAGDKWEMGGVEMYRGGLVEDRSALMGDSTFPLFCFPDHEKWENSIMRGDVRENYHI